MAYGAGLESQLGAISQGFESLILRQNYLIPRWRWDLNPRLSFPNTRFRGALLRPLGHATVGDYTRALALFRKEFLQYPRTLILEYIGNYFDFMDRTRVTK